MNKLNIAYKVLLILILAAILFEFLVMIAAPAHQASSRWALALIIIFVILVEIRIRIKGGSNFDALLKIHLWCAIPLLITLILINFWFNGSRYPYYDWLAYVSFALFLGTTATGVPMILKRF